MTKLERETNINYNKNDEFAEIYTTLIKDINRLNKMCIEFPEYCKKEKDYFYIVDKSLVNIKTPRILTKQQKSKLILNLKNNSKSNIYKNAPKIGKF
jgi:hypothetical protein